MQVVLFGKHAGTDGPSRVTRGVASGLAKQDINVTVLGYGQRSDLPHPNVQLKLLSDVPSSVGGWRALYQAVQSQVEEIDPDIFHALERYPYESDIRTVQWTSDMVVMWERTGNRPSTRALVGEGILNWYSRQGATKSRITVAQSAETVSQMQRLWKTSPDRIIPLGIEAEYLTQPQNTNQPPQVLVVGRVSQRKGQKRLLKHLDPDDSRYKLHIIGGKADEDYASEALDGWEAQYRGYLSDEQLTKEYEQADIVVVPSHLETFSVVALEAIAKGCVVVITDTCGFAQFEWANQSNGVFVVNSGKEAANVTAQVAESSPETLLAHKQAAFKLAQSLTWNRVVEQYINQYERLTPSTQKEHTR